MCVYLRLFLSLFDKFFPEHKQAVLSNWSITPASENVCVYSCRLNFLILTSSHWRWLFFAIDLLGISKKMKMCVNGYCFATTTIISEISNVLLKHSLAHSLLTSPHYFLASFEYCVTTHTQPSFVLVQTTVFFFPFIICSLNFSPLSIFGHCHIFCSFKIQIFFSYNTDEPFYLLFGVSSQITAVLYFFNQFYQSP